MRTRTGHHRAAQRASTRPGASRQVAGVRVPSHALAARRPDLLTPDTLLQLQRLAGNRSVAAFVQGPPPVTATVQRAPTGMAVAKTTATFAGAALEFWREPANKDKSLQDLGDALMEKVNDAIATTGAPDCLHSYTASGDDAGAFDQTTWTIEMNPAKFSKRDGVDTVGELDREEVARLVDTIYHEARHSEQWFRVARMWAGNGKDADEIKKGLGIPKDKADAAFAAKLTGDTKANKALIAEGEAWDAFTKGKYHAYWTHLPPLRNEINDAKDVIDKHDEDDAEATWTALRAHVTKIESMFTDFFDDESERIGKLKKQDSTDKMVLADIKNMKKTFLAFKKEVEKKDPTIAKVEKLWWPMYQARYDAYRHDPTEVDAWKAGAAAAKAFNALAKKKKKKKT